MPTFSDPCRHLLGINASGFVVKVNCGNEVVIFIPFVRSCPTKIAVIRPQRIQYGDPIVFNVAVDLLDL